MKITKTANGKKVVKMSKKEWQAIGKKAGWFDSTEMQKFQPTDQPDSGGDEEWRQLYDYITSVLQAEFPTTDYSNLYETKNRIRKRLQTLKNQLIKQNYSYVDVNQVIKEALASHGSKLGIDLDIFI